MGVYKELFTVKIEEEDRETESMSEFECVWMLFKRLVKKLPPLPGL